MAGPITVSNLAVVDGLFQASLDFGVAVLDGSALWLQVAVRSPHDPGDTLPFTTLDPPQPITAAPYALQPRGLFVDTAGNVGIGTNTPTEALEVAGTVVADAFLGDGSGLSGLVGSTVDLDNVALLRWDLLNRSFSVGSRPLGVAFDGANIWIANLLSDNVTKLQASGGVNLGTIPVGDAPFGVAFDGANIWVANHVDNKVTRLSLVK